MVAPIRSSTGVQLGRRTKSMGTGWRGMASIRLKGRRIGINRLPPSSFSLSPSANSPAALRGGGERVR